jgi:putative tryptophan/tyrosine transport system substrate-binding protein
MSRHSACPGRWAAVAVALWILLTPQIGVADVQVESSPDTAKLAGLVRAQVSGLHQATDARVTIGAAAFRAAIENDDGRPVIAAYLSSTEFTAVLGNRGRPRHVTAVFSNPDPLDELALARAILSHARVAAFDSPAAHPLVSRLVEQGVSAIPVVPNEGVDALLRGTDSFDVILVLPDPSIFNSSNIGHVVRTLYQQRKVLIGYSDTLTRVGSLASVYPSPEGIAGSVKTVLDQYVGRRAMPDPVFVSDVNVSLNERLARSLNIILPNAADLARAIRSQHEALR